MDTLNSNTDLCDWFGRLVKDHARTVANLNNDAETLAFGRPLTAAEVDRLTEHDHDGAKVEADDD